MPLKVTISRGESCLWNGHDAYPLGSVIVQKDTGKIFFKAYHSKDGSVLVRLDDGSLYTCSTSHFKGYEFREVKAELKVEL